MITSASGCSVRGQVPGRLLPGTCPLTELTSSLDEQRAKINPITTRTANTPIPIYRYLRLRMLLHLLVLGDTYFAEIADRYYHGDVLVGLGVADAGGEVQLVAFGFIKDEAL